VREKPYSQNRNDTTVDGRGGILGQEEREIRVDAIMVTRVSSRGGGGGAHLPTLHRKEASREVLFGVREYWRGPTKGGSWMVTYAKRQRAVTSNSNKGEGWIGGGTEMKQWKTVWWLSIQS